MSFSYIVIEACGLGSLGLMVWFFVQLFKKEDKEMVSVNLYGDTEMSRYNNLEEAIEAIYEQD